MTTNKLNNTLGVKLIMQYIVCSDKLSDLTKAVEEHGVENVYWLADSTRNREADSLGLPNSRLLPLQKFSKESVLALFGDKATVWGEKAPAPKKAPAKKSSPKKEE